MKIFWTIQLEKIDSFIDARNHYSRVICYSEKNNKSLWTLANSINQNFRGESSSQNELMSPDITFKVKQVGKFFLVRNKFFSLDDVFPNVVKKCALKLALLPASLFQPSYGKDISPNSWEDARSQKNIQEHTLKLQVSLSSSTH